MKLVAKCSASISLSYQVHIEVCNPIPLKQAIAILSVNITGRGLGLRRGPSLGRGLSQ